MKQYKLTSLKMANRCPINRKCFLVASMVSVAFSSFADAAGAGAIQDAATTISGYQESVKTLMNAIACVIAIVGAFNVYFKMQNGDQDVKKTIMLTLGGCIAFVCLAQALPLFFK